MQPSDEYLINCIKNGEIDKTGIIYDRHFKNIYSYFYRLTRNKMEAEDLAQNVFIRVIRLRSSFKADCQFAPWLYKIAHNIYIDHCKLINKVYRDSESYSNAENTSEQENKDYRLGVFYKAFEMLKPEYRELLIMSRYQGLTYKQIGIALNLNEKAVKQKAFRAIEKLRVEYFKLDKH